MSNSSLNVKDIRCFWLTGVEKCGYYLPSQTVQEFMTWLEQPRVATLKTLISTFQASSSLHAPAIECRSSTLTSYPRFEREPNIINEWFFLSGEVEDSNKQGKTVNAINVDAKGKKKKCYTRQGGNENFPAFLSNENYEVFFHGTTQEKALNIIDGIQLQKGKLNRDFSSGKGFYLCKNFDEALNTMWARQRPPNSAVVVFQVNETELRRKRRFRSLDLRRPDDLPNWEDVVRLFRTHLLDRKSLGKGKDDKKMFKDKDKYDFIEGPICSEARCFSHPCPIDGSYQFCVKSQVCAELFDQSLHSVVFFERN